MATISFYATGCNYTAYATSHPNGIDCPQLSVSNVTGTITIYAKDVVCDSGYSLPADVIVNGEYVDYLQSTSVSFSATGVTNVQVIATRDGTNPQGTVYINRGTGVSQIFYDYCVNGSWYSGDSEGISSSDFAVTADVDSDINITGYTFTNAAIYGLPTTFQPYTNRTYATTNGTSWTSATDTKIRVKTATRYIEITASGKKATFYGRLNLNANGGTINNSTYAYYPYPAQGETASIAGANGATVGIQIPSAETYIPKRDGYKFAGWENTSGHIYAIGDYVGVWSTSTYQSSPAEVVLYAVWEELPDIALFYWDGANGENDAALIAKGQPVSNITATRWNNLLKKIKELADACGASFSYTTVSSGDGITAARFNAARTGLANVKTALGAYTTLPAAQESGNTMYATLFNGSTSIKGALNALIGVYNNG